MRRRDLILAVLEDVIAELPLGSTTVSEEPRASEDEIIITLQPRRSDASPIIISSGPHAESVFLEFGEATVVELTELDERLLRQQLGDLLWTVTGKGFIERTWRHKGAVIQSEADLPLQHGPLDRISSQFGRRRLLAVSDIAERRFSPYV